MDQSKTQTLCRGRAILDLVLVLGILFSIKEYLLRVDGMWTYAGPISLLTAVTFAYWRLRANKEGLKSIGLRRPKSIIVTILLVILTMGLGVGIGIVGNWIIDSIQSTFQIAPAVGDERLGNRFANLQGSIPLLIYWLIVAWVIGGFTEEILFRGFLLNRFNGLLKGAVPFSIVFAILIQAAIFGQQHIYYQGWEGFIATGLVALLYGVLYILFRGNLWPMVISHGLTNTIGLTFIYLNGVS